MPISGIEFRVESTGQWVTVENRDPADEDGLRLLGAGSSPVITILYADIPGNSWNQNRLDKFRDRAQALLDVRIPLNDPSLVDDPDALTDPARPDFFHDAGDLVARTIAISVVTYSAQDGLNFRLERVR